MTGADDTELDAIAAQARAVTPLPPDEVATLLAEVREGADTARDRLVEQQLRVVLDEAVAHGDRGVDVLDLFQEGTVASIVAVDEYAARAGDPSGLSRYARRVVAAHLDRAVDDAAAARESEERFVRDAQLYETAEVSLRHELGRSASVTELAAVLQWTEERVALVGDMLTNARDQYDSEIVQFLDDESDGDG